MEERVWEMVEEFISGYASPEDLVELQGLLKKNRTLFNQVKEFLEIYKDPDPRITEEDKRKFFNGIREGDAGAIFFQTDATPPAKTVS